jgi:hypothetical protein
MIRTTTNNACSPRLSCSAMRRASVWTLIASALLVVAPSAQAATTSTAEKVKAIRQTCTAVENSRPKLTKRSEISLDFSLEGAAITYYSKGRELRKLEAEVLGETYQNKVDLCYQRGKLVFAFERFARYESDLTSPLQKAVQYRYYFNNGKLIQMTVDSRVVKPLAKGAEDTEGYWSHKDELLNLANELTASFAKPETENDRLTK